MLSGVAHLAHVWVDHGVFAFHYDCEHDGWLVGIGFNGPLRQYGRLPERGRKKWEMIDERQNVKTSPPVPTTSAVGPCPTILAKLIGRPGTGSLPSTIAPPNHPSVNMKWFQF